MTNTRITDPEILEIRYPVMLREYNIRANSGGRGKFNGGNGVVREIQFLKDDIEVGILSERRAFEPFGLLGGENAMRGKNIITYPDGRRLNFGGKNTVILPKNSMITVNTPGGGGFGK
jgi:5-oxoprolinase (ATP-hydrolysing)